MATSLNFASSTWDHKHLYTTLAQWSMLVDREILDFGVPNVREAPLSMIPLPDIIYQYISQYIILIYIYIYWNGSIAIATSHFIIFHHLDALVLGFCLQLLVASLDHRLSRCSHRGGLVRSHQSCGGGVEWQVPDNDGLAPKFRPSRNQTWQWEIPLWLKVWMET